jgi:hypothetical protein
MKLYEGFQIGSKAKEEHKKAKREQKKRRQEHPSQISPFLSF